MKQKLYAFWTHDQFPFVLGGEVIQINDDSTVEIKGYGKGYRFNVLKIVPLKAGMIIKQDLDKRTAELLRQRRDIENTNTELLKKQWRFIK